MPQLRCFVTVVSTGSVAEAGRRLGMSAASVSKAIRRLEDAVGVRLLHRSTHALSITPDGERLLEPARATVRAAQDLEDAVDGDSMVRITGALALIRHVIAPLTAALPSDLRLDIRATNEIVDLADDGIDLAIRTGTLTKLPGHIAQAWFETPWVMCAAPRYLDGRTLGGIADLPAHDLIGFRNRRTGRIEAWPHKGGRFGPDARIAFDDGDAVWDAMLAGAGIACAPLYLAASALRSGRAIEVLPKLRGPAITVSIVRRERRLTPARVTKAIGFLKAHTPSFRDLTRRA
ncbi:MAG TPA: LysR family transcriptional regulator [Kofleriaceae bacterium]